jgi:hypothetical protein
MTIADIQNNLAALNAANPAPKAKAKKKSAAAPAAGMATVFVQDELHLRTIVRVVKALNLEAKGVTAEILVAGVKQFEGAAA